MSDMKCTIDLLPALIFGAEENGEGEPNGDSGNSSKEGQGEPQGDPKGSEGDPEDDEHDDKDDPAVKGLKSALASERRAARAAIKERDALKKDKDERELAEKSQIEQAEIKIKRAEEKATKLAEGLLKRDLNAAITKAAKDFVDPDDAINLIDRSKLVWTQDEDDPTDIEIDTKSIERAVKELATKKPHFLKTGTDDGEATGSAFGGTKQKKTETDLKELYPSLR